MPNNVERLETLETKPNLLGLIMIEPNGRVARVEGG